jgi:hypothetical protein
MKEAEVGRACSRNGRTRIEMHTKVWVEDLTGRDSLPVLVISWRMTEIYLAETEWETVRSVKLAEAWISGGLLRTQ